MIRPIGMFDSGLGGLAILQAMIEKTAHSFIYVADQAFVPYGTKTKQEIKDRVRILTDYLDSRGVETTVIACNTASVASRDMSFSSSIISMVDNVVEEVREVTKNRRVLVLSTDFTARSHVYLDALSRYGIDVIEVSSSRLVELVENGKTGTETSFLKTRAHLKEYVGADVDTVVLGCTHFGWLKQEIGSVFKNATLVLGDRMIARKLQKIPSEDSGPPRIEILTTGSVEQMEKSMSTIGIDVPIKIDAIRL